MPKNIFFRLRLAAMLALFLPLSAGAQTAGDVKITHLDEGDGFTESRVTCVVQAEDGLIWFSTWDGLYRYDGYRLRCFKARPGDNCPLETNRIDYICEMEGGDILCRVLEKYYVFSKATGKFAPFEGDSPPLQKRYAPDAATTAAVEALDRYREATPRIMFTDRQGGVWVQSSLGFDRLTLARKPIGSRKAGDEREETVRGMAVDKAGRLWVSDKNKYVRLADNEGNLLGYLAPDGRITPRRTPFGRSVYCIFEDSRGYIWLGTRGQGLFRLSPKGGNFELKSYTIDHNDNYSINNNDIYSLAEDAFGHLWVGTYGGGLNVAETDERGQTIFINAKNGPLSLALDKGEIHSVHITKGGTLIAGTNYGLYTARIESRPERMTFHKNSRRPADAASLSNNRVMDIVETKGGQVWLATYGGGLCQALSQSLTSDTVSFKPYTTDNGLASDVVVSAVEDSRGNIWMVSGATLSCLNPTTGVCTNYKGSYFSGGFVFSEARPLCLDNGTLVIGTTQGTLAFNPDDVAKSAYVPYIYTSCGDTVSLGPDERTLAIEIAAMDYDKNEQPEYAFRMEGIDSDWRHTTDPNIYYANLPAGTFLLTIRSTNGDGVWVDNARTIVVERTPHFNERPLAWMLYGGLALLLLLAMARVAVYIRRLRRELRHIKLSTNEKIEYIMLKRAERTETAEAADAEQKARDDADWEAQAMDYLEQNLADTDFNMDDFAKAMGMSRSDLFLNVKRIFGFTPKVFIREMRIVRAKKLLKERKDNVSEVAYKCGFADPHYFSRCFKAATGMNPKQYAEQEEG